MPIVPKANHLTLSFVLSFVSRNFCSRILRYSSSWTISLTVSSIRRSSVSTGFNFSEAWMADQSRASAPISMSNSTWRVGLGVFAVVRVSWGVDGQAAGRQGHTSSSQGIFEADVEGCVRKTCECHSLLACDILWSAIVIANCIFDLYIYDLALPRPSTRI